MTDASADRVTGPTPDTAIRDAERQDGPMLAADGTPLKSALGKALRRQKLRALMLIAPLLLFIMVTFIAPIADMLFRSVENDIVSQTLPRTVVALDDWEYDSGEVPSEEVFEAFARDLAIAAERKDHTRLGSRLNYETTGISSLFRQSGRGVDEIGEPQMDALEELNEDSIEPFAWAAFMGTEDWAAEVEAWDADQQGLAPVFRPNNEAVAAFPETVQLYSAYAETARIAEDSAWDEDPFPIVFHVFAQELAEADPARLADIPGPAGLDLVAAREAIAALDIPSTRDAFLEIDEDWADPEVWGTIKAFSSPYTAGYYLAAMDLAKTPAGVEPVDEDQRIYRTLFLRTMVLSLTITGSCILLGYPIAWLLANLPLRTANVLMILVLLPFWTSLLVRTSAWKVLLQQQGVINDILVWAGLVGDGSRLVLINNATGTIIAMTHILLPFMILPLYSVMKTIDPSYLRAAKSLGATNWTAFWRVYFPNSVPGIGAGSILVFILAIGYYITPEIVGGTKGVFISNRIAYHISSSLNWGLAAALGTMLLALVLLLYWLYDRMVGIDNVKLGG